MEQKCIEGLAFEPLSQLIETALLGHWLQDLDHIEPLLLFNLVSSQGCSLCFSLHMAISHAPAFCPRRVAQLCPLGPHSAEAHGAHKDSDEVLRKCSLPLSPLWYFFTPLTLDLTLRLLMSPELFSQAHTLLYPQTQDLMLRAVVVRRFGPCTF